MLGLCCSLLKDSLEKYLRKTPGWFWPHNLSSKTIFQENNPQGERWEQSPAEPFLLLKTEHGCQARRSVELCVHLTTCAYRQFLSLHCHPQPRAFVRNVAQPSWTVWCLLNSCWVWAEFLEERTQHLLFGVCMRKHLVHPLQSVALAAAIWRRQGMPGFFIESHYWVSPLVMVVGEDIELLLRCCGHSL